MVLPFRNQGLWMDVQSWPHFASVALQVLEGCYFLMWLPAQMFCYSDVMLPFCVSGLPLCSGALLWFLLHGCLLPSPQSVCLAVTHVSAKAIPGYHYSGGLSRSVCTIDCEKTSATTHRTPATGACTDRKDD
jgi:hypothetical protein